MEGSVIVNPRGFSGDQWLGMATQSSSLENSMGRRAWQAIVHGVAKSRI